MQLTPVKIICPVCQMKQTGYIQFNKGSPYIKCALTRCSHIITGHEFGNTTAIAVKTPNDLTYFLNHIFKS